MAMVHCKACGKIYNYDKEGFCPKCGAYNRPPRRQYVNADGTVYQAVEKKTKGSTIPKANQKVCYEKKECHEGVAQKVRQFTPRTAPKAAAKTGKKSGKWIGIVIALAILVPNIISCVSDIAGDIGSDIFDGFEDIFEENTTYADIGETFYLDDYEMTVTEVTMQDDEYIVKLNSDIRPDEVELDNTSLDAVDLLQIEEMDGGYIYHFERRDPDYEALYMDITLNDERAEVFLMEDDDEDVVAETYGIGDSFDVDDVTFTVEQFNGVDRLILKSDSDEVRDIFDDAVLEVVNDDSDIEEIELDDQYTTGYANIKYIFSFYNEDNDPVAVNLYTCDGETIRIKP